MAVINPPSIDRRRFLEIGAAASLSLSAALAIGSQRTRASEPKGFTPHAVIYDERFAAARRFAVCASGALLPAHPIRGDVTQLWYSHLYPLWKRTPAPIAGLTAYAAMFCLERLAWDQQLRMVRCAPAEAPYGSAGWPMERAAMITRGIRTRWLASPRSGAAADGRAAAADGPLHLWLIAPPAQLAFLTA